ncbi:Sds3-like-domain-containing protein [Mucidula mucida]|nr:Sds3-like-domain-containing protein [Mucidula mucida]
MRIQVEMEPDQDMEVDADVTPDDDMGNEMESELLPAHRAEALDVLASIEFKFGRLRETLYVERMEQLAWEESLITDGTHPELLHYQKELSARRDKRIELASRKRELEIATIQKKRRVNEDGTWSWWQHERDQLQTDMIAENNRKKRKLERERRAVERPQPVRRIPHPPVDVPPAPTLREIADSFPFSDRASKRRKLTDAPPRNVYPELSTLSNSEVNSDLEFLYSLRRPAYEPRMPSGSHLNGLPMGGPMYDSFPPDSFPRDRMPPPPGYAHHLPQPPPPGLQNGPSSVVPPFPFNSNSHSAGGRTHHHHHPGPASNPSSIHNPPGNSIHGPSPFAPMDPDIAGPHSHYGSTTQPPPPGFHGPGSSRRSSMSPAPSTFAGKGTGQWMGAGMGMPMFNLGGPSKGPPADWITDSRQEDERREREHREREHREREHREREAREARDKEYDRREREREHYRQLDRDRERDESLMAQQQQQMMHRHPSHSHGNPVHPHHHHRPHHHHVVHHHHTGMGPSSAGPSLSPRAAREYERPHSRPNAEIINLSASKSSTWKGDEPPPRRPMTLPDERDRPAAVPFAMGAPPHRTNSPRASWSVPDGYRESSSHRYPPASSSSSRPPLPNPLSVSPQTRTLPPPTSPNRYRDDLPPPKKLLPPLDGRPPVDPKNGMRMNELREKDRMLSSPPPRMALPPRVPQLVDGS